MTEAAPRVVEALNRALHRLFEERADVHLLGEDVLDPYGGAFKVSRGLSTRHPDRVHPTPLSEAGIAGVASGLALAGDQVVLEAMFGDFAALMFDQVLNLASKSVTMYGRRVPVRLLLRCPVGGRRGYGPTHSQSLQKHFIGIPNLALYELTPFHDPYALLVHAPDHGPAMLFEDKVLYTRRMLPDGAVDEHFRFETVGEQPGWAHVVPAHAGPADAVLICPGGVAHRAIAAANLARDKGIGVELLVPGRLYPLDVASVVDLLARPALVAVAEESTAGGTWGAEVAAMVHERLWSSLRAPVLRLSSADSVIPAATHLEERVLLGERHIAEAITGALGAPAAVPVAPPASEQHPVLGAAPIAVSGAAPIAVSGAGPIAVPVTTPKLNSNDAAYLVLDWLVADGDRVEPGTPLVEVETSKAVEEIAATAAGVVRIRAPKGSEVSVGALLAEVVGAGARAPARQSGPESAGSYVLDRVQRGVAAVVSRAHREVPAAFSAIEFRVDPLVERLRHFSDRTGAEIGLPEAVVKAVGLAHDDFGRLFGSMVDEHTVALAEAPHVAVTVDAGRGLYSPVVRDCAKRSIGDISDDLMDFRMKAMRGEFTAADLAGGAITVSLNTEDGVLLVHPIVMWPQLCMLSLGGLRERVVLENGEPVVAAVVTLGLAYDHRAVNGGEAVAFLRAVATRLGDPDALFR